MDFIPHFGSKQSYTFHKAGNQSQVWFISISSELHINSEALANRHNWHHPYIIKNTQLQPLKGHAKAQDV